MSSRVALISTGGTIEKTYDQLAQVLTNEVANLDVMLDGLELRGVELFRVQLMNKDSLEMTPGDHELIARTALAMSEAYDGVVVVHGTDRLTVSGDMVLQLGVPKAPVVLTGAMRPYELRSTDAVQNLTEALLAVQLLSPGVYLTMHNRVLSFPGVAKNAETGSFEPTGEPG